MANHVDSLHTLYWFRKKSTGSYYKGFSRTPIKYKKIHCVKNHEIWAFSNPDFAVFGQNRIFCLNTGKYRYDSVHIRGNTDQRKPVFGHVSSIRILCDISERLEAIN